MSKYDPLSDWLTAQHRRSEVTLSFPDVEQLIGGSLPQSARHHQAWWANSPSHVQALAWLQAGWVVDVCDQSRGRVRFRRSASPSSGS